MVQGVHNIDFDTWLNIIRADRSDFKHFTVNNLETGDSAYEQGLSRRLTQDAREQLVKAMIKNTHLINADTGVYPSIESIPPELRF